MKPRAGEALAAPRAAVRLCRFFVYYGLALLLAGFLLLAHGCHGDQDNELFNAAQSQARSGE